MFNKNHDILASIGRISLSIIFATAGYRKIFSFASTAAVMNKIGIPQAELLLFIAIVLEFGGGILLLAGLFSRFAAFLLILFTVAATFLFHSFWDFRHIEMATQFQQFLKNWAIVGGLIYVVSYGPGSFSLDKLFGRLK